MRIVGKEWGYVLKKLLACPQICNTLKKYTVEKVCKSRKVTSTCRYNFKEDEGCCEHLLLWDTLEVGRVST